MQKQHVSSTPFLTPALWDTTQSAAKSPYVTSSPYGIRPAGAQVRSISGTATVTATARKGGSKVPTVGSSSGIGAPPAMLDAVPQPVGAADEEVTRGEEAVPFAAGGDVVPLAGGAEAETAEA